MAKITPKMPLYTNRIFKPTRKHGNVIIRRKITKMSSPLKSMLGINKILDTSKSWLERCIWSMILFVVFAMCCSQLLNCIVLFFNNPVIKQTDIVRLSTVRFPTICVCPGIIRQLLHLFHNLEKTQCPGNSTSSFTCFSNDPYEQAMLAWFPNFDSSRNLMLWSNESLDALSAQVKLYTSCHEYKSDCEVEGKELKVNRSSIDTFWGKCLILDSAIEVDYKGPFTYLTLQFKNVLHDSFVARVKREREFATDGRKKELDFSLKNHKTGLLVSIHSDYIDLQNHFMFFSSIEILQGFETHMLIRRQQINLINRKKAPCVGQDELFKCFNSCFDKKMSNICKPPYIHKSGVEECTWNENFSKASHENINVYSKFNFTNCHCLPACNSTRYRGITDVVDHLPDDSMVKLKFYFTDPSYDRISEKYTYGFTACLSDFGGNLGFFLGFSVLTIVEFVDLLVRSVVKMF